MPESTGEVAGSGEAACEFAWVFGEVAGDVAERELRQERPMPIYVGLGNWTDQGTKDFRGSVQRGNGFRELVEQAGGRVRELVWTMGEYDFITVLEAPDDETAATLVLRVAAAGNVRTKTMRAFDADQMSDIIARTG
jgi:uncharacterized protein with GYD domain